MLRMSATFQPPQRDNSSSDSAWCAITRLLDQRVSLLDAVATAAEAPGHLTGHIQPVLLAIRRVRGSSLCDGPWAGRAKESAFACSGGASRDMQPTHIAPEKAAFRANGVRARAMSDLLYRRTGNGRLPRLFFDALGVNR